MNRRLLPLAALPVAVAALVLLPATPASAHPLGNFSVNQYLGLTIGPDHLRARAIVDIAEIPTLQDRPAVDTNADGRLADAERADYATATCARLATDVTVRSGDRAVPWLVSNADYAYTPGAGGLDVSRLSCGLTAALTLGPDTELTVDNRYLADRVGWREMTAIGDGVRLADSPLPSASVSAELTRYPPDLLSSTLDVRSATLRIGGPAAGGSAAGGLAAAGSAGGDTVAAALGKGGDPLSRWMATVDGRFQDLAGGPDLTPLVGLLAVGLALLLGAGHAALPGHGKTVLAGYLAGRRGRPRDALTVAGTVTLTHTGGVLVLGLLLTAGSRLAGERILGWLGLISGTVVLAVGAGMLLRLGRTRLARDHRPTGPHGHSHAHSHDEHAHGDSQHGHPQHDHSHDDDAHGHPEHGHPHDGQSPPAQSLHGQPDHGHSRDGHSHDGQSHHGHTHAAVGSGRSGRLGLVGVGVAGGLVPSPSALVVLLAAIGLGRTGFGILLVVAYGAGMAATLAGAGLLLLALQRRLARRAAASRLITATSDPSSGPPTRSMADRAGAALTRLAQRVHAVTPTATAALVFLVGLGLAVRAVAAVS